MTRIKVVPKETPNADGEWLECPFALPVGSRWRDLAEYVSPIVPGGYFLVAVECGPPNLQPIRLSAVPFPKSDKPRWPCPADKAD